MKYRTMMILPGLLAAMGVLTMPAYAQTAQSVTNALRSTLEKRITSPGGKLTLRITPGPKTAQGYFNEVYLAAKPAEIKGRRFSLLVLRARNVRVDVKELMKGNLKTLSSQTSMRAAITEAELTRALARGEDSADKQLRVKFLGNGQVRVNGRWQWSWFSGPMEAVGKLRLGPNYTVVADIASLKLNGANVPAGVKNKFQESVNPLIDYNDLPFRPPFKAIRFSGSKALITAGAG